MGRRTRSILTVAVTTGLLLPALAQTGPANGVAVGTTGFCSYDGIEYAPRWSMPDPADPDPSTSHLAKPVASEVECAELCAAQEGCMGATFQPDNVETAKDACYLKTWTGAAAQPCLTTKNYRALVKGDCASIVFKASEPMQCDDEKLLPASSVSDVPEPSGAPAVVPAAVPAATWLPPLDLSAQGFWSYSNMDYVPIGSPNDYQISAVAATTAKECAAACAATAPCNMAAFFAPDVYVGLPKSAPCYLKYVEGCELPPTAQTFMDGRYTLIKGGGSCPLPAVAAAAVPAPAPATVLLPGSKPHFAATPQQLADIAAANTAATAGGIANPATVTAIVPQAARQLNGAAGAASSTVLAVLGALVLAAVLA